MELSNEFVVPASIDVTWLVLTDLERIAPCLPGAQLEEVEGDEYRGTVRVKVGPIAVQYKGTATFVDLDEEHHKAVLRATGRDVRGQGNATAVVTAQLRAEGATTVVGISTELDVSGKVAQFGRGMLADVSTKLLGQFADRLETDVISAVSDATTSSDETVTESLEQQTLSADSSEPASEEAAIRHIASTGNAPVNLVGIAGSSMMKRLLPAIGVALFAAIKLIRRRRARAS